MRNPRTARRQRGGLGSYLVLGLLFVVVLFPVYYGLVGSFMGERDTNSFPPALWPVTSAYTFSRSLTIEGTSSTNSFVWSTNGGIRR